MNTYKITLLLKSSLITPLQADTIWGSFCWALKYLKGEGELEDFLTLYQERPPLIVSDGIPEGWVPKPILKSISFEKSKELAKKHFGNNKKEIIHGLTRIKKLRKQKYLPMKIFEELKGKLSEEKILDRLLSIEEHQPKLKTTLVFRNTINRFTGTVLSEGGLHPNEEFFYDKDLKINIFIKTNLFNFQQIKEIFEFISLSGFGRSASSGKGALNMIDCREESVESVNNPNAFMSISSFVPEKDDPVRGFYQLITKWGKLGGDYAKSALPFKKPLLMFSAGSIFFDHPIKEYYGRLIAQIHPDGKIRHYGYSFPIGVRINEDI